MGNQKTQNKELICIVGPTAVGKTDYAVDLALRLGTEVINADSRQFYREMNIGTAKPDASELRGVEHHLLDFLSIHENYTVADFEKDALDVCDQLFKKHEQVIVVGGSGLYINALCFGLDDIPEIEPQIRNEARSLLEQAGIEALRESLEKLHPAALENIDPQNPHRLLRAYEVLKQSGHRIQDFQKQSQAKRPFDCKFVGLNTQREFLYARINKRVDRMMERGLLDEVNSLRAYQNLNALKTVGYQEFYQAEKNGESIEEVVAKIKQSSRRYAKRQITWFKKMPNIQWIDPFESE